MILNQKDQTRATYLHWNSNGENGDGGQGSGEKENRFKNSWWLQPFELMKMQVMVNILMSYGNCVSGYPLSKKDGVQLLHQWNVWTNL